MLEKESDKYVAKFNQGKMLYSAFKQYCKDAPREQLLEHTGGFIVDGIVLYLGGSAAAGSKVLQMAGLAGYQATALSKLGDVGRQIQRVVGLAAKAGVGKVEQGLQIIKDHPQIVKAGQAVAQAIQIGREALRQTNRYLKETSRAVAGKVQKIQVGEQIKKIPRACVAKIKQVVDDEAIVVDTWGNTWRSPVNSNHWEVQLSEMGKKNLVLLNEAAATRGATTAKEIGKKVKRQHVKIPMCPKTKAVLKQIKTELRAKTAKMQHEGVTYGKFYSDNIHKGLNKSLVRFKNFRHEYVPEMPINWKGAPDVTGFHWDQYRRLEELGFIKLENVEYLTGGMYKAKLIVNGVTKKVNTFFPSEWGLDKLLSKISESCHNLVDSYVTHDGITVLTGKVSEGFYIITKVDKRGRLVTAYPVLEFKPRIGLKCKLPS
jgi:hypothetical protein